ncbi:MAG TPA: futalosine hydrolase [Sphingobacteriaceae bacterium]|nr:futalosine hydrolase [Sphingobacteriaceae bacterium]
MKILLVSATEAEIFPIIQRIHGAGIKNHQLEVLITGVGMVATAYSLGKHLAVTQYDLAINAGIAGSFDRTLPLGEVVQVSEDVFAEMGAEDDDDFLPIDKLGFGESRMVSLPTNFQTDLTKVKAITVNRVHGNENTIYTIMNRFHPQIESMEGAAFFYSCNQAGIQSLQIRSISNYVERRNRENWNIGLAIKNLNDEISTWLEEQS